MFQRWVSTYFGIQKNNIINKIYELAHVIYELPIYDLKRNHWHQSIYGESMNVWSQNTYHKIQIININFEANIKSLAITFQEFFI